jgi:mannose-6-phosphate isomerase
MALSKNIPSLLKFIPTIRNYIWGGRNLLPVIDPGSVNTDDPIAEVWAVYEKNLVKGGAFAGYSLARLTEEYPDEVLGTHGTKQGNKHFPLLIKLLDCKRWLSLQVHPNDEQAHRLEGPQVSGKTEAWHVINAENNAQLIMGIKPNVSAEALHTAIGNESILDLVEYHSVQANDTIYMPAGTIHALGPGLLVYEVQQTSDLTYRVFDWNRPQTNGRVLHIEKSIAATDVHSLGKLTRSQGLDSQTTDLVQSPYFDLEMLSAPHERNTNGESFHALTVISGMAQIATKEDELSLNKFDTVLVPAVCGKYRLEGNFQILCSSLPN